MPNCSIGFNRQAPKVPKAKSLQRFPSMRFQRFPQNGPKVPVPNSKAAKVCFQRFLMRNGSKGVRRFPTAKLERSPLARLQGFLVVVQAESRKCIRVYRARTHRNKLKNNTLKTTDRSTNYSPPFQTRHPHSNRTPENSRQGHVVKKNAAKPIRKTR